MFTSIGGLAVYIFFIISGYVIARSWDHKPIFINFIRNRFLRIFPALLLCYLVMIFLCGPFLSTFPIRDYLKDSMTWTYFNNIFLYLVPFQFNLPGVFLNNPTQFVNGALWTLPIEFFFYILFAIVASFVKLKHKVIWVLLFFAGIIFSTNNYAQTLIFGKLFFQMELRHIVSFAPFFSSGVLLYLHRQLLPKPGSRSHHLIIMTAIILLLAGTYFSSFILYSISLPVIVVLFAFSKIPAKYRILRYLGNFSYGMYLYGWFSQQLVIQIVGIQVNIYSSFMITLVVSLIFGVVSWYLLESQMIKYKSK